MRTPIRRLVIAAAVTATAAAITSPAWAAFPNQGNRILHVRQPTSGSPVAPAVTGSG